MECSFVIYIMVVFFKVNDGYNDSESYIFLRGWSRVVVSIVEY